jgi:hypothetical protein
MEVGRKCHPAVFAIDAPAAGDIVGRKCIFERESFEGGEVCKVGVDKPMDEIRRGLDGIWSGGLPFPFM